VYVGSEPKTYADTWAKQNHPERIYQEFIEAHRNDVMLNAGLLGGTRADVMAFAHGIIRLYYRIESYRFWKKEQAGAAVGDMMALALSLSRLAIALSPGRAFTQCLSLKVSVRSTPGLNINKEKFACLKKTWLSW
jgi:hypothetical protein